MKRMAIISIVAGIVMLITLNTFAFDPSHNIGGIWSNGRDPGGYHVFQNGNDVKSIYVNRGFNHFFSGKYTSATTVEGVCLRQNRTNGCVTKAKWNFYLVNADSMKLDWEILDSNCDIQKGNKGTDPWQRQKSVEEKLWY